MIGGFLVGVFCIASLAFLTWSLIKTHKSQTLSRSSRAIRTGIIGFSYSLQLAVLLYLSTKGGAYLWFRSDDSIAKADTPYAIGLVLGIFLGSSLLYWMVSHGKKKL